MTGQPKFKNIPNEHVILTYESKTNVTTLDYWISRAVAVVGVVLATTPLTANQGGVKVLVTKRSKEMRDEPGKHVLPCGYLDWDESGYEGMVREVWEETSLYLPDYKKYLIGNNDEMPVIIHDKPTRDARQNVSMIYLSVYDFEKGMEDFPIGVEKYTDVETEEVRWMPLLEFFNRYEKEYEWGFRHDETIKEALKYFNRKFQIN